MCTCLGKSVTGCGASIWHFDLTILNELLCRITPSNCCCCQAAIRKELNEFKSAEMEVHEESKKFTRYVQFFLLKVIIVYKQ